MDNATPPLTATLYEHPLNEGARTLLRLEHLFNQATHHLQQPISWDGHNTVAAIDQILNLSERIDIKKELCKELERHNNKLQPLKMLPDLDQDKLRSYLDELKQAHHALQNLGCRIGENLRNDEFLNAIRQRLAIPGGCCSFDLPAYHYWLSQPPADREAQLHRWLSNFQAIYQALYLCLKLTRQSAEPKAVIARRGFLQTTFSSQTRCQMLRVFLPANSGRYPEISGNKHRMSIRFFRANGTKRPLLIEQDVAFEMACCML